MTSKPVAHIVTTEEIVRDAEQFDTGAYITRGLTEWAREARLDMIYGPRYGPPLPKLDPVEYCARHGHDDEPIIEWEGGRPVEIRCARCGEAWSVSA